MPKTQWPDENRDDVLSPAMERARSGSSYRQVGRRCVEEDADQNVNYYEEAGCAEESAQELHSAHVLSVDLATSGGKVASDLIGR
jgi:hypothetical protein